ncbi:ImmA/IrrE family metallo-endopeptidase [Actinoplanes sp. NPDC051861]|uniref:ImmA/IrrE family metallo-endopeptidase n=1 Tax=Actinoplanes sp. NPDC051861 TaxID=3155170 RepID=UPI003439AB27
MDRDRPGVLERLRVDALAELSGWPDVQILLVNEQAGSGGCSVAGSYDDEAQPPALCVARSASHRRWQFTALHELGHHLQINDIELATTLLGLDDDVVDAACDGFAARVLLPDDVVDGCFAAGSPSAGDVVRLYAASTASRAACVVRAAEHLRSSGAIVLYDSAGVVSFAAANGVYPPARGSDQAHTPLVAAALKSPGRPDGVAITVDATTIRYRTHDSGPLYGQAAWCDGYLVAVLVEHHAPWQKFSPTRTAVTPRRPTWSGCELCTDTFEVTKTTEVCSGCGQPRCPVGHCRCTQNRERPCDRCHLTWAISRFPGGGTTCADCL